MTGFNGFSFNNNSSSSSSSSGSSSSNQTNDEATIKKIIEAIEVLEKLAKDGAFPPQKLHEIKKELEKKYPNIFSTQNINSQKPGNNNNNTPTSNNTSSFPNFSPNYSAFPNIYPNSNPFSPNLFDGQDIHRIFLEAQQQQMMYSIQAQNQMTEQLMKMYGVTTPGLSPNYGVTASGLSPNYGVNYPDYSSIIGMMGNSDYGLTSNLFAGSSGFVSDGSSAALSFLGSLLGGFGL